MTTLGGVSPTNSGVSTTNSSSSSNPLASLANSQEFLQLLVAQLKYQDPLDPVSGTQFIAQTAELSQVEMLTSLSKQVGEELSAQQLATADGLIGKDVTATTSDNKTVSGTVSKVSISNGSIPMLDIGGTLVPLNNVENVS